MTKTFVWLTVTLSLLTKKENKKKCCILSVVGIYFPFQSHSLAKKFLIVIMSTNNNYRTKKSFKK